MPKGRPRHHQAFLVHDRHDMDLSAKDIGQVASFQCLATSGLPFSKTVVSLRSRPQSIDAGVERVGLARLSSLRGPPALPVGSGS